MKILVVESPAKSKTIGKYLGKEYVVVPSFGHVRDLPSKNGSVDTENNFSMVWEKNKNGANCISNLSKQLKKADELLLATDPDREGEAISWHILDCLKDDLKKTNTPVKRITFHEITKKAILEAIKSPRDIDKDLVDAYLARRALDYLFGFSLSPVLWRKLPGCKSAGRVQSVALRILTDRENEIEAFVPQEFWSVIANCANEKNKAFDARLTVLNGKKVSKFTVNNEAAAIDAKKSILASEFHVSAIEKKDVKRNPVPPFTTSTLQQEASRKLNFTAKRTMQVAQNLYEGVDLQGETKALITYMRTDSVNLSQDFIDKAREFLATNYGENFIPKTPNRYKSKVKNAQEAHEAIRPIDVNVTPESLVGVLEPALLKLYTLIWKRAVSSQMSAAIFNQVQVDVATQTEDIVLHAVGTTMVFEGYLKLYEEGKDVQEKSDDQRLPVLTVGEKINVNDVACDQHFTTPPARYTEATLVKKMEELGIGRPSTYATIIQVLQDRKYATINKKAFIPELRGRIVIAFLTQYFPKYLEYDFTANMEEDLDDISNNKKSKDDVLNDFWKPFANTIKDVQKINMKDVIDNLDKLMTKVFFGQNVTEETRKCPQCQNGVLGLKLWSSGAFLGCSNYPDCDYKRSLNGYVNDERPEKEADPKSEYPKLLGQSPKSGKNIYIKSGPYGLYFELDSEDRKRASLPKQIDVDSVTLEQAEFLLSLPKKLGEFEGEEISVGRGKFGPFLVYKGKFTSIKNFDDFLNMNFEKAKELLKLK